jgi:hypothetical protein
MNVIDLKSQYGARYRVTLDQSADIPGQSQEDRLWLQQIQGKYGHCYIHGQRELGAYVRTKADRTDRLGRLLALPGSRLHQRGDFESSVVFDPANIDAVAGILKLHLRRRLSDEQREASRQRMARINHVKNASK